MHASCDYDQRVPDLQHFKASPWSLLVLGPWLAEYDLDNYSKLQGMV